MASITTTVPAITKMVCGQMEAIPIKPIVSQPTLPAIRTLIDYLTTFVIHFTTIIWGGLHGFLPIFLTQAKMQLKALYPQKPHWMAMCNPT